MASLFRLSTSLQTSRRMQALRANATDSGMDVLLSILVRQALVLVTCALVVAAVIG